MQNLVVARSFTPVEAPEDEDTENPGDNESDGEASVGDKARDDENINDPAVEQRAHNLNASSDAESSPATGHDKRANVVILDAASSADTPASQKRSFGGFVDEDSLFDEYVTDFFADVFFSDPNDPILPFNVL